MLRLTRIIHDGSLSPTHPSLPHSMGEGEGGGRVFPRNVQCAILDVQLNIQH